MGGNGEFAHMLARRKTTKYLIGKAKKQRPRSLLDGDFQARPSRGASEDASCRDNAERESLLAK